MSKRGGTMRMYVKGGVSLFLASLVWTAPLVHAGETKERAYTETHLGTAVSPADAALFERYFGTEAEPVAEAWDAEKLVQYASSWGRNKAGKRVLRERLMLLAENGSTMRKIFCERFESAPDKRVNFTQQLYHAIVPFVFASHLVDIVDRDEETLSVDWVLYNPQTRQIERTEHKQWTRRELRGAQSDISDEEAEIFRHLFPSHKWRRTPPTWDAAKRVVYSARGRTGARGAYALNGYLKHIAPDGRSCRIAVKTLETKGAWICHDRPWAHELSMVKPFVFVELKDRLRFYIEQFHPQTGAYSGTHTKEYDFRTLELLNDTRKPAASAN
ncbi:MAG: hypothetical protein IJO34_06740 [Akkermansia sp.]|nr:hypothetical protein [Akkermansia sp.]